MRELLENPRFFLEAWMILSCHIGALSALRYPSIDQDREKYIEIVLNYSGKKAFYEQVDLLFLYQWPASKLKETPAYKRIQNYQEIAEKLHEEYGSIDDLKLEKRGRYINPNELLEFLQRAKINKFNPDNCRANLHLFSLAEILYRYVRCEAVHRCELPLVSELTAANGSVRYEQSHAITGNILYDTAIGIIDNLSSECLGRASWPHELNQQL